MAFFSFLNDNSDITDITWRDRGRFSHMDAFSKDVMEGDSELTRAQKETIAAFVSGLNACQFCYGSHKAVARQFGVTEYVIQTMVEDLDQAPVVPRMKPILQYAKKLTNTPSRIVEDDVNAILAEGWTEDTVQDVIAIVCLFNFYNRLLDGHGVKGSEGIFSFAGGHLAKRGYGVPWFINWIAPFIRRQKLKHLEQNVS